MKVNSYPEILTCQMLHVPVHVYVDHIIWGTCTSCSLRMPISKSVYIYIKNEQEYIVQQILLGVKVRYNCHHGNSSQGNLFDAPVLKQCDCTSMNLQD